MSAVAGMMALTGSLGVADVPREITNFTFYGTAGSPDGGFSNFPDLSVFYSNSNHIKQVGTLSEATAGMDRYIVFLTCSQTTGANSQTSNLNPTARLAGTTMTTLADNTRQAQFAQSVSAHYAVYNSAGSPTIEFRKRDGGTQDIFAMRTAAYSFEVPSSLSLTTTTNTSTSNSDVNFTIDQSGALRVYFSALHKGNDGATQTITKNVNGTSVSSIRDAQGDCGTNERFAFGSLAESDIGTSNRITYDQNGSAGNNRRVSFCSEMLFN